MKAFESIVERLLYITLLLSIGINVALGVYLYYTTQKINNQTTQIERYISCVVTLFTRSDRAQIVISDVNKCSLVKK